MTRWVPRARCCATRWLPVGGFSHQAPWSAPTQADLASLLAALSDRKRAARADLDIVATPPASASPGAERSDEDKAFLVANYPKCLEDVSSEWLGVLLHAQVATMARLSSPPLSLVHSHGDANAPVRMHHGYSSHSLGGGQRTDGCARRNAGFRAPPVCCRRRASS